MDFHLEKGGTKDISTAIHSTHPLDFHLEKKWYKGHSHGDIPVVFLFREKEIQSTHPSLMDDAMEHLIGLYLAGAITPQTYVNGLRVLAETPLTPAPTPPPRRRRAQQQASTPAPRQPPPQRVRPTVAEERPSSTDQDGAMERLIGLFLAGDITPETHVNGIKVLTETPLTPAPIPPLRRRRASRRRRAQQAKETPSEQPTPPPAGEGLSQFHPARASTPAGEGFSQFHPARASSPAGEGLSRTRNSWRFTGLAGPLGHTCADGR